MKQNRDLPIREQVFIRSLILQGFRYTHKRKDLKFSKGYVIPATEREDARGTDMLVKMPRSRTLLEIQIKQRGVKMHKRYKSISGSSLETFIAESNKKIAKEQKQCWRNDTVFVLVSDYEGKHTTHRLSWRDVKALRRGVALYYQHKASA